MTDVEEFQELNRVPFEADFRVHYENWRQRKEKAPAVSVEVLLQRDADGEYVTKAVRKRWEGWLMAKLHSARLEAAHTGPGVGIIAAERRRQVESEGYTATDDDQYGLDVLARAGACYALPESLRGEWPVESSVLRATWPWDKVWWKPTPDDRVRELAKAGALIAAEIDRVKRAHGGV